MPKKKKCAKAKWLSDEALHIAVKREVKSKREKERYTHLNAEVSSKGKKKRNGPDLFYRTSD